MTIQDYPYLMNASQLAQFLGVSRPTAYEIMRTQLKDKAIKLSDNDRGNVRVLRDDVVSWLESRRAEGA